MKIRMKKLMRLIFILSVTLATNTVFAQPQINPRALNFGNVQVGESKDLSITISNNNSSDLIFTIRSISGPFIATNDPGRLTLTANQSFVLQIRFSPTNRFDFSGSLIIDAIAPNQTTNEIPLSGSGFGPRMILSPNLVINFGDVDENSSTKRKVLVLNLPAPDPDLNADLKVDNITTSLSSAYSVSPTNFTLALGDTKSVTIIFHPPDYGSYDGNRVTFFTNDKSQAVFSINLNGFGLDKTPPLPITQLTATWGNFDGYTNADNLSICWQNPVDSSGIAEVWWKFSSSVSPPQSATDTTKFGGRYALQLDEACVQIPLRGRITTGFWNCYIWLVDGSGNSGYLNAIQESFVFDITPPKAPTVLSRSIPETQWFGDHDTFTLTVDIPTDSDRGTYDAREIRWKFNSIPSNDHEYDELILLPGNGATQFTFSIGFDNIFQCGENELYLWFADSTGNSSKDSVTAIQYRWDICNPVITRKLTNDQNIANAGEIFQDRFIVTDQSQVDSVLIQYRLGGAETLKPSRYAQRVGDTDEFIVDIPAQDVTSRGLEIRIKAIDIVGNGNNWPDDGGNESWFPIRTRISGDGEFPTDIDGKAVPLISGVNETSYQLFSVPFSLNDGTISAVVADDLGKSDDTVWRLFDYRPEYPENSRLLEGTLVRNFNPGRAFFVITSSENIVIDSGPGLTINTIEPYKFQIYEGWNLVATPFAFPIHKDSISFENETNGANIVINSYEKGWKITDVMEPWKGYAIYIPDQGVNNNPVYLVFNPKAAPGSLGKSGENLINLSAGEWLVRISATAGEMTDENNWVGVRKNAKVDYDQLDFAEPPVIGDFVSVSFPHSEWDQPARMFSSDIRPIDKTDQVWDFRVESNQLDEIVILSFDWIGDLPEEWEIYLIDESLKLTHNLKQNPVYSVKTGNDFLSKNLRLAVGKKSFVENIAGEAGLVPGHFKLFQNFPNPFNPETNIRYNLAETTQIKLMIYDLQGRLVRILIHGEEQTAGFKSVLWDGRSESGLPVSTGVYIYTVTTGKKSFSRKMLMMK